MERAQLSDKIYYLNTVGGFAGALNEEKIAEVALKVSPEKIEKLFEELENNKDTIKDPTAWVTSAMRKASGGGGGGGQKRSAAMMLQAPSDVQESDAKLRKRIGWLNKNCFGGAIIYDKVVEAAGGIPYGEVMTYLKELEEKKDDVKDPNAWVCAALRKAGGGGRHPPQAAHFPAGGGWPQQGGFAPMMMAHAMPAMETGVNDKVRKRINWLNGTGGFQNALTPDKVAEAAVGVDVQHILKVLKDLEEKRDTVKDPLAYVTSALRKASKSGGVMPAMAPMPMAPRPMTPAHAAAWTGAPAGNSYWESPTVQSEDQKLRKRIGWLNGAGGFQGALLYDEIVKASGGLEFAEVFRQLKQLEEKVGAGEAVRDPNAWVCSGLRRAASKSDGGQSMAPALQMSGPPAGYWAGGAPMHMIDNGAAAAELDPATYSKLHKRCKWLNGTGGFADAIIFDKVAEAAAGLDSTKSMDILKDLETKKDSVKDPTAYVTAAMRKAGGGQGRGMLGVRKTISKR